MGLIEWAVLSFLSSNRSRRVIFLGTVPRCLSVTAECMTSLTLLFGFVSWSSHLDVSHSTSNLFLMFVQSLSSSSSLLFVSLYIWTLPTLARFILSLISFLLLSTSVPSFSNDLVYSLSITTLSRTRPYPLRGSLSRSCSPRRIVSASPVWSKSFLHLCSYHLTSIVSLCSFLYQFDCHPNPLSLIISRQPPPGHVSPSWVSHLSQVSFVPVCLT